MDTAVDPDSYYSPDVEALKVGWPGSSLASRRGASPHLPSLGGVALVERNRSRDAAAAQAKPRRVSSGRYGGGELQEQLQRMGKQFAEMRGILEVGGAGQGDVCWEVPE